MSSSALDEARSRIALAGGTIGEQLVAAGHVSDDALTAFYTQRLLVPQVHPNVLARLPDHVVAVIPGELAISLRAIPVSLDVDQLTLAMGDPADHAAAEQIATLTGAKVVRAVATQMQIAWCLAHYYGHVTDLGVRLLQPQPEDEQPAPEALTAESVSGPHRAHRRAPSVKPFPPDDAAPALVINAAAAPPELSDSENTAPLRPRRRRPAEPNPPELSTRAGELVAAHVAAPVIASDAPSVVVDAALGRPPDESPDTAHEPSSEIADRTTHDTAVTAVPASLADELAGTPVIPAVDRLPREAIAPDADDVATQRDDPADGPADGPEDGPEDGPTAPMTAVELDVAIPHRPAATFAGQLVVVADLDDDWGPPGTTIPPPLFGTVEPQDDTADIIPLPNLEYQQLIISSPSPPESGRPRTRTEVGVARMLEQSTWRVLELIRRLERAADRDEVVATMITHLAESHRRAGLFAIRGGELSLFAILPQLPAMPTVTLRLDTAPTLEDLVVTRLPYRGAMHDRGSRDFLQAVLGAPPAEILLVPITVRERVVGVLFGEHRMRYTFDDQLALASAAAGKALERILLAKRLV